MTRPKYPRAKCPPEHTPLMDVVQRLGKYDLKYQRVRILALEGRFGPVKRDRTHVFVPEKGVTAFENEMKSYFDRQKRLMSA